MTLEDYVTAKQYLSVSLQFEHFTECSIREY